jgi:hypothetical protein
LRSGWQNHAPVAAKVATARGALSHIHPIDMLGRFAANAIANLGEDLLASMRVREGRDRYATDDEISF